MSRKINCVLMGAFLVFACGRALAGSYYVSPGGADANDGGIAAPWLTIQHAVDSARAGDTIRLRSGVYKELVNWSQSGSAAGGYITLRNFEGESPVIDGSGLSGAEPGLVKIIGRSYVRVVGLELRNLTTASDEVTPAGIWVRGASHHVELLDNVVHHIESSASDGNAHGIAVYGDKAAQSIHDLLIDGNEVRDCILKWSESLVLNGNVEDFVVTNNVIHDNDNIGIDFIGHEGTSSDPATDRARDGLCSGNTIYNIDTATNSVYAGDLSAGGVYVDGGQRIVIEKNIIHDCNMGVEIASEWGGKGTDNITVRNNFIYACDVGGVFIGGYDALRGWAKNCAVVNNTLYGNDALNTDWGGEIVMNYYCSDNVFKNNIVFGRAGKFLVRMDNTTSANNTFDYNIFNGAGAKWTWNNVTHGSFAAYASAAGQGAHSFVADPLLVNPTAGDLHLSASSPALDAGENLSLSLIGTEDIDGDSRPASGGVDIGADEVGGTSREDGARKVNIQSTASLQNPAWSPDGNSLLFTAFRNGYNMEPADLIVIDLGSNTTRTLVSDGSGNINLPGSSWNPTTGQITFASMRDPHDEIYRIDANGNPGDEVKVTERTGKVAYEPSFSPDGQWVVFESHPLDVETQGVITTLKTDGTGPYQALSDAAKDCRQPNWSPAGDLILYQRLLGGHWDIWTMNADGTNHKQITSGAGDKTDASFSADGQWIVYSSDEGGLPAANLFIIPSTGGDSQRVTTSQGYDGAPSWSPDGTQIAFESYPSDDPDGTAGTTIWVIDTPNRKTATNSWTLY